MNKHAYSPSRVFNMDETAVSTVMDPPKVVSKKGSRRVGLVTSAERGQNSTAVVCCNAAGMFLPPQFIFARKRHNPRLERGAPPGSVFAVSDNGWATKDTFVKWLEHFVEQTGASPEKRQLLVMDNHCSHIYLMAIQTALQSGIDILTLPPHTSHRLQPLDVAVFGPIKTRYRNELARWMRQNPGQRLTTYDVCAISGAAYLTNATPDKAVNGFRACGIVPLNREVFSQDEYEAVGHVLAGRLQTEEGQVASTAAHRQVAHSAGAETGAHSAGASAGTRRAVAAAGAHSVGAETGDGDGDTTEDEVFDPALVSRIAGDQMSDCKSSSAGTHRANTHHCLSFLESDDDLIEESKRESSGRESAGSPTSVTQSNSSGTENPALPGADGLASKAEAPEQHSAKCFEENQNTW